MYQAIDIKKRLLPPPQKKTIFKTEVKNEQSTMAPPPAICANGLSMLSFKWNLMKRIRLNRGKAFGAFSI